MTDNFSFGDKITAKFRPKSLDTLRACMVPLIGRTFLMEWAGVGEDDEPYPGQSRWIICRKHDAEVPDEAKGRWLPFEDLSDINNAPSRPLCAGCDGHDCRDDCSYPLADPFQHQMS